MGSYKFTLMLQYLILMDSGWSQKWVRKKLKFVYIGRYRYSRKPEFNLAKVLIQLLLYVNLLNNSAYGTVV